MHDILIGGLIAIIVIVQILVALGTSRKIALFKRIIPQSDSFETIRVFVPENEIKTVTVAHIFDNIIKYQNASHQSELEGNRVDDVILSNDNQLHNGADTAFDKEDFVEELDFISNEENYESDDLVWVVSGNFEERIHRSQLAEFEQNGYSLLDD